MHWLQTQQLSMVDVAWFVALARWAESVQNLLKQTLRRYECKNGVNLC